MTEWHKRPVEFANLLNPAFCSIIIHEAVKGYEAVENKPMPFALIFFILPIVLHENTRMLLPRRTSKKMHEWLHDHPEVKIQFADRVQRLIPYTKESIIFGVGREVLSIEKTGNIKHTSRKLRTPTWIPETEPENCRQKAAFLGRWLAISGDSMSIYTLWGVRP